MIMPVHLEALLNWPSSLADVSCWAEMLFDRRKFTKNKALLEVAIFRPRRVRDFTNVMYIDIELLLFNVFDFTIFDGINI